MSAEIEGEVREVDEERAIVVRQPDRLAQAPTPEDTLSLATRMATALKDVVEKQSCSRSSRARSTRRSRRG
jgi:hypothetical protein